MQLVQLDTVEGVQVFVNPRAIVSIHPLPAGGSSLHMVNGTTVNVVLDVGEAAARANGGFGGEGTTSPGLTR
jgi:hypothetical protein